jgi:hypothetical protein
MWKKPPRADEQVHSLDWEQYTAILARDKTSRVRAARTLGTADDSDIFNPELRPLRGEETVWLLRQNSGGLGQKSHLRPNFAQLYT